GCGTLALGPAQADATRTWGCVAGAPSAKGAQEPCRQAFRLRVGSSAVPETDPPSPSTLSRQVAGSQLVVADDDRLTRGVLAEVPPSRACRVATVPDGQAAVERVGQGGVDLVLLDALMPRVPGLEACRVVNGMTSDAFRPVALLTVRTDSASRVE